jgi:hypothetical protein
MTIVSGNQATAPSTKIQDSIDPKNNAPNRKPSQPASRAVSTRRNAHRNGAGAMNTRKPQSSGGNDAHMRRAATRTAPI